ncbi:unnamed protein product [Nezara viridula]|uniref:Condensin complex subunit 1 C-terminal domain-containing protein n=1 Tax=Nezara viridula TaxID=85310 RepID=A0A9P0MQ04_NEZVI|nr:unnamed protein product [Nezara viridula]
MSVLEAFASFHLELVSKEWVDNVWETDFYNVKELPNEYESQLDDQDFSELISNLIEAIEGWNAEDSRCSTSRGSELFVAVPKSWTVLIEKGVDYKAFLCILSVFLKGKKKPSINVLNKMIISSRLYFALLSISGSHVFNIFNSILYYQALQIFTDVMGYCCSVKKKGKNASSKKNLNYVLADNDMMGHSLKLSDVEIDVILNQISLSLDVLSNCLNVIYLKDDEESLVKTIQVLVSLTQVESNKNVFYNIHSNNLNECISRKSFLILEQLCSLNHGDIKQIIFVIMRNFLQTMVIREEDIKMATRDHISSNVNTFVLIQRLLQTHEKDALPAVKGLIQQMCVRLPDRTDIRSKALPQIIQLLQLFKYNAFLDFVIWLVSLAHSEILKYRLCAIELIAKLLNASEITDFVEGDRARNPDSDTTISNPESGFVNFSCGRNEKILTKFLIGSILARSLDASAIIRSKCLNIFASLLFSNQKVIKEILEELVMKEGLNGSLESNADNIQSPSYFDFQDYLSTNAEKLLLPKHPLPSVECILHIVGIQTCDQNVYVRKNALLLILNLCLYNKFWLNNNRTKIFLDSCLDSSLMMRKFSVKCLTDLLLSYPSNANIIDAWVQGVVSLIADNDVKCQEKVIESIGNVILNNLADYSNDSDEFSKLPWEVLNIITESGKRTLFKHVCHHWSKNKVITKMILKTIETHIGTENNINAWFLVVCISEFQDYPEPNFISDYFLQNVCNLNKIGENVSVLVVEAVFLNWKGLSQRTQEEIYLKLKDTLECFKVPLTLISRYLDICYVADKEGTRAWSRRLVQLCEEYLRKNVAPGCSSEVNEQLLCRHIHTLGDASQFHPGVHNDIINYLVDIIDPTSITRGMTSKWKGTVSSVVKAIAIVTLGKICLQDHFIAKTYAPVLASALSVNSKPNVKINSMIALTDLCIRFTSVVEDYLGDICVMLRDEDINVRVNCLKLLIQLLQEDYLKPKGALFFYLLITLGDPDSKIRGMTESFIENILLKRNPSIMSYFFIQAIFFFNDYEGVGSFNKEGLSAKERRIFSMAGKTNFDNRGNIYKYMLSNMRDDHRFKLSNRICADILDEVIDGNIPLERVGSAILKDALFAMACDEMRLENMRKGEEDSSDKELEDAMVPEHNGDEVILGFAKKVFLSQIVKTNYVEYIVPTISKLKRILADRKSPLVRDLMICLRELMKDFREEINDILHSDPELAAEVSWDLKNISKEDEPPNELSGEFNIKELRVSCERLSEKALSEKMGISISSIKSLQAQSAGHSNSNSADNLSSSHSKLPTGQERSTKLSFEKSRRSRRNTRLRSRNSANRSQVEGNSNEIVNNSGRCNSSLGTLNEEVFKQTLPGPSSSFRKTFEPENSSSEISWIPSFHSSPNLDKRSSKSRTSLDSECSTSCSSMSYASSIDSSSGVKKKQSQEHDLALSVNQTQDAGPSQMNRRPSDQKSIPSPKSTKEKKRKKGKRK